MSKATPRAVRDGLRLGATTFTIAPVRAGAVNRVSARVAMSLAPAYGLLLGLVVGGVAIGLRAVHSPGLLTGVLCVATGAILTRGLHLDGLADTVDALGSYAGRDRALAIMASPEVGPFGVAAIVLALSIPAAAIAGHAVLAGSPSPAGHAVLAGSPSPAGALGVFWYALPAMIVAGFTTGRMAVALACRRGVPAARQDGLGAMVAGVVGVPALVVGTLLTMALAIPAVPDRPWQGPASVLAGLALTMIVTRHVTRRIGGITGDVLGACVEIATAVAFAGMALGS